MTVNRCVAVSSPNDGAVFGVCEPYCKPEGVGLEAIEATCE